MQSYRLKGKRLGFIFTGNRCVGAFDSLHVSIDISRPRYPRPGWTEPFYLAPNEYVLDIKEIYFRDEMLENKDGEFTIMIPVLIDNEPRVNQYVRCLLTQFSSSFHMGSEGVVEILRFRAAADMQFAFPFPLKEIAG